MTTILSFGGGVDSSTLIAIDLNRDLAAELIGCPRAHLDRVFPSPDRFVFADTGGESQATYHNVDRTAEILAQHGRELTVVKREGETITEWCLRLGIVPLMPGGSHVCSLKFKGEPMAKWAAAEGHQDVTWVIGIEANETNRSSRFTKPRGDESEYIYPLIDLGLTRDDCLRLLEDLGWHQVEKSSCVFCPFKTEAEIRDMYLYDLDAWELCVEIEAAFEQASHAKHQAWLDAGQPLNKGGRAPRGMWRKNSYQDGARLFARGKKSLQQWADRFAAEDLIATNA